MCFFSHLLSLLVSTKQWSFATSTLFRLSWSTTGWLSRLRRLQNKKLRSRYSLLLTHMYCAVLLTHRFIVLLVNNIWSSNPITPAHSPHHHHKEIPRRKKHCLGKPDVEPSCWLTHMWFQLSTAHFFHFEAWAYATVFVYSIMASSDVWVSFFLLQ